ncbi:hypothetical protein OHU34_06600 [Streptomyces sp. NBC_00080]|uniref:hypothetical protein n=1 Tax=unclassified Streptomyces TaxID=2593676 RepID=UPI00114EC0E8|nr:hypothetical protein [Streptomyces sp. SLBN-115]TQJ57184.1 hypothetical protein FBY34_5029 [Streptomyces sp. SLBN-115]
MHETMRENVVRLPTATLLTACALSAALIVAGRGGAGEKITMPGADSVVPAAEGRVVSGDPFAGLFADPSAADQGSGPSLADAGADPGAAPGSGPDEDPGSGEDLGSDLDRGVDPGEIGPETVPEVPDLPDGGGLIPDGPDESGAQEQSGSIFGSPLDVVMG